MRFCEFPRGAFCEDFGGEVVPDGVVVTSEEFLLCYGTPV
jgi:hypothetical protein